MIIVVKRGRGELCHRLKNSTIFYEGVRNDTKQKSRKICSKTDFKQPVELIDKAKGA